MVYVPISAIFSCLDLKQSAPPLIERKVYELIMLICKYVKRKNTLYKGLNGLWRNRPYTRNSRPKTEADKNATKHIVNIPVFFGHYCSLVNMFMMKL